MDWKKAIELLENGEAECVCATAILLRSKEGVFLSFDGYDWEKADSEFFNKQF